MKKKSSIRRDLTPKFLAAARRKDAHTLAVKMLHMTEDIRQDILLPASRKLGGIVLLQKENAGMVSSDAKNVTIQTDRDCEDAMEKKLKSAFPDALILGEEMFGAASKSEKSRLLQEAIGTDKTVFLVDALDATRNFTQGGDGYGVMITAMKGNKVLAAVVRRCANHADPENLGHTLVYEQDDGVRYDGKKLNNLSGRVFKDDPLLLRGYAGFEFINAAKGKTGNGYPDLSGCFDSLSDLWTCSTMYADLLTGQHHFMLVAPPVDLFDYPPGIALLQEAGGVAKFLDGTPASFEEMVKRQSFSLSEGDESYKNVRNTLVLAVSGDVFNAVQKTINAKIGTRATDLQPPRLS